MENFKLSVSSVLLAFWQVTLFSFVFALPIRLLWYHTFTIFTISFLPTSVTYFSLVGVIFILLTIFKIIRTLFR